MFYKYLAGVILIACGSPYAQPSVQARSYHFKRIAGTSDGFQQIGYPVINQLGDVAYWAELNDGRHTVIRHSQQERTVIVSSGDIHDGAEFDVIRLPIAINDSASVAFSTWRNRRAVYRYDDDIGITKVAPTDFPLELPARVDSVTNIGVVGFESAGSVYVADGRETTRVYTGGGSDLATVPDLNEHRQIAFSVFHPSVGAGNDIMLWDAGTLTQLDSGHQIYVPPSINNRGDVFYIKANELIRHRDGETTVLISSENPSVEVWDWTLSVNDNGDVLFGGRGPEGGGYYLWSKNIVSPALLFGQELDGEEILDIALFRSLNERGQFAFTAEFVNGTMAVYVASPIPEPDSAVLILVTLLITGSCLRRVKRAKGPPLSVGASRVPHGRPRRVRRPRRRHMPFA